MKRFALALLTAASTLHAQTQTSEADCLLELRRAELNERQSAAVRVRKTQLFEQGLVSKADLDAAIAEEERARIDTERAKVQLANELPSFRVLAATKSIGPSGEIVATVRLVELERGYAPERRRGYLVSLESGNSIISIPYQQQVVTSGVAGRPLDLHFRLLRDVDEVKIAIVSGTRREEVPILFDRGDSHGPLNFTCANDAQTAVLGTRADFALQAERFGSGAFNYELRVDGLPAGFTHQWLDADTKATVAGLHFDQTQSQRKLVLQIFVPDRVDEAQLRDAVRFRAGAAAGANERGSLPLQLRVTAAPRLVIAADNLFGQIASGETSEIAMTLQNGGGIEARDVVLDVSAPTGLTVEMQPPAVKVIGAKSSVPIVMRVSAPRSTVNGDYNVKVQATSSGQYGRIDSPEVTFRFELRSRTAHAWVLLPVFGLFGACAWGVYWVTKTVRK